MAQSWPQVAGGKIKLSTLLAGIASVEAANDRDIRGLSLDSRCTQPGDLFLACAGLTRHGMDFIDHAIRAGAVAVVYELTSPGVKPSTDEYQHKIAAADVPMIAIVRLAQQAGIIASRFFGDPSRDLFIIGITGTNGKTSCCHFLAQVLSQREDACGVIGTLGYGVYGSLQSAERTTPDAVTLQSLFADMRGAGVKNVVMEVSSHGLDQGRTSGTAFNAAIFTNLSHDHLDYHGDISSYAAVKHRLFETPQLQFAIINVDDDYGCKIIDTLAADIEVLGYSVTGPEGKVGISQNINSQRQPPLVRGKLLRMNNSGLEMEVITPWGKGQVVSSLLGRFNASNLLATLSMLLLMDIPLSDAVKMLAEIHTVPGRMEYFKGEHGRPLVVVDYAHSPDALKQVLQTLCEHCEGQLWCVFGCGGNRDRSKRPLMGAIAEQYADHIVITDDNPRFEDAAQIITDILGGMQSPDEVEVMHDRGKAIAYAIHHAVAADIVLVAGKGHEEYQ